MPAATLPRQTGLKRLAGGLAFVCLVLFLLAIDNRQAVGAWRAIRNDAAPAAGQMAAQVADWAGRVPSGASDGLTGLKAAVQTEPRTATAAPTDVILTGEFQPADDATREATGSVAFVGAEVRFETGEVFRTLPLRIAAGREAFVAGQTFADRLNAPGDAQIELRRIAPAGRRPVPVSTLCGGVQPGVVALLYRGDRVDLMVFRVRTVVGPDAPVTALCGVWRFRGR